MVPSPWLGLNYNSLPSGGRLDEFAARGIALDREGELEPRAGALALPGSVLGRGLERAVGAGMVPDVQVDTAEGVRACTYNPDPAHFCLPTTSAGINAFVTGFVRTAQSARRRFPHTRILFEPTDEPWSWGMPPRSISGYPAAAQFATILARLFPAVARARDPSLPLQDIYVPATGRLEDGSRWVPDLYRAEPCLRPAANTCGPIQGWNAHPYGLPGHLSEGIDSLPGLRREMLSGNGNVIASELGFCAMDVEHGRFCSQNRDIAGSSVQVSGWLRETLARAWTMHRQGWLRAVLVWARSAGGWSMELPSGELTAQGRVLEEFARRGRSGEASA